MKQPTKDILREQLVLAAERIIDDSMKLDRLERKLRFKRELYLRGIEFYSRRWWHRFAWWRK